MKLLSAAVLFASALVAHGQGTTRPGAGQTGGPGYGGANVDKATMAKLTAAQKKADAAFKKSPKNAAARQAFIDANNRHGLAAMRTEALDRKVKYRVALADFRKVLKVDPKNSVARENHDLIVSIYKSMKRPVPGG